ncbi:hypothetical protein J3458_015223 [Metarhizium acridum]|uniref:Uncharacterized protein n=1 Tax=Metarhizium acridum (strain CQMa 102) TaxID=655827 RepID=E9E525_METAQ|nr:uncharacterized protein MAC_04973 [Metarhizium acridum CQMa 102]EFY89042.1 hypothetical protein MAC_04973 [Metarhizium acridum CQMa 102]KAG8411849.1 hypothetical protein J3458_015145 [Metarhizium acridum]KAG8411929.1 hypothetical protein J3458_015223 [Metarhizium acridum]
MFKSTLISLAMLAIAPLALADNCTGGLSYCGSSLLKKGRYTDQINQALLVAGQPDDYNHVHNSIFYCLGGSSGAIQYTTYCSGSCQDNGQGRSDTCA